MSSPQDLIKMLGSDNELSKKDIEQALRIIQQIKEQKLNIDLQDEEGKTALIWASAKGYKEILKALIAAGANKDLQDKDGNTALMLAVNYGDKEVIEALIEAGANKELQDKDGNTALMLAEKSDQMGTNKALIIKALIAAGANKNSQNKQGITALMWAAFMGHKEVVEALIEAGANKDLQDDHGDTALMSAAVRGNKEIVGELIAAGANKDLQDKYGNTALMLAVKYSNLETIFMLTVFSNEKVVQEAKTKLKEDDNIEDRDQKIDILENPHKYIEQHKGSIVAIMTKLKSDLDKYKTQREKDIEKQTNAKFKNAESEIRQLENERAKLLSQLDNEHKDNHKEQAIDRLKIQSIDEKIKAIIDSKNNIAPYQDHELQIMNGAYDKAQKFIDSFMQKLNKENKSEIELKELITEIRGISEELQQKFKEQADGMAILFIDNGDRGGEGKLNIAMDVIEHINEYVYATPDSLAGNIAKLRGMRIDYETKKPKEKPMGVEKGRE